MREGYYFGAGPAALPTDVIQKAAEEFVEYDGQGVGLGEISHRSKPAIKVIDDAKALVADLLEVPATHEVLFVQGGGTGGFASVIYNLIAAFAKKTGKKGKADYLVTGSWSAKAIAEARRLRVEANYVCNGKDSAGPGTGYTSIPSHKDWKFSDPKETAFVYFCDNETVDGIEFQECPSKYVPEGTNLVMDMSSNMFSRRVDVSKYAVLFGGAQKNVGIAGVSVYIVRKDLLEQASAEELHALGAPVGPSLLDFSLIAKNNSAYNTVSIFAVEIVKLVLQGLKDKGGLEAQEKIANEKSEKLYSAIDARPDVYKTKVVPSARSRMNIVFNLTSDEDEARWLKLAAERQLSGLKGHRSVGGIRISNYNAITVEAVDEIVKVINEF